MPYQIRIRRDTTSNWTDNNPILAIGEMGFDLDTQEVRVGNGTNTWTELTPIRADNNAVSLKGIDIENGTPSNGDILQYNSATEEWEFSTLTAGSGDVANDTIWDAKGDLVVGTGDSAATILPVGTTNGYVLKINNSTATGLEWGAASGSGTVTSVGLTMPSLVFTVDGSPVTTAGTLGVTLNSQTKNRVFASPNGSDGTPTFRTLVVADIPDISTSTGPIGSALASITSATNEVGSGADQILYLNAAKNFTRTNFTSAARTLVDDASTSDMRTTLGLTIGTNVQAQNAALQSIAGLTTAADRMIYTTASNTYAVTTLTTFGRSLVDDTDATAARTTLGFSTVLGVANSPQAERTIKYVRAAQASLTKGMVVYVSGSSGDNLNVSKAQANAESTSSKTIGLLLQDFTNVGDLGYVITEGLIDGLNTNGLTAGDAVWLDPSTAGSWTTTKPSAPNHQVFLGWIVKVNSSTGSIYVKVQNGQEIDELHDVQISSPTTGQLLQYDGTVSPPLWKNQTLAIGTTANLPIITTTSGVLTTGTFGTTANTFCQGNDSRLDLQTITLTGNVTGSGTGSFATTIANGVITPAMFSTSGATSGDVIKYNGTAWALAQDATGSGSGSPGGSDTQVQFNDGGNFGGDSGLTYNKTTNTLTITGDLNVNGGELESSAATFNLLSVPSTVNLGAVATTVNIGNADNEISGGAATINLLGGTLVGNLTTQNIFNTVATTGNILGAATSITMGATTGTTTLRNATITLSNATTLNVNGASPTLASSSTGTLTLFNTNLLTVNAFGAATSLSLANTSTSTQTINLASSTTGETASKTLNIGSNGASGSATALNLGTGSSGTVTVSIGSTTGSTTVISASTILANRGELRFAETTANGSNYVGFKAAASLGADLIWELPAADGSANQVLSTNGSGVLSWATAGTGSGTKTYSVFQAIDGIAPETSAATLDTRPRIGSGEFSVVPCLEFDSSAKEYITFQGMIPEGATATSTTGLKVRLWWANAGTGSNVNWGARIENIGSAGTNVDTENFNTAVEAYTAVPATSGILTSTEITFATSNCDSLVAGDPYILQIYRDPTNSNDANTSDAQLIMVELRSGA